MNDSSILLKGLDGSNPLAFLAALGTLRTLMIALPDETVKMSWELSDGAWRPRVYVTATSESFIAKLSTTLSSERSSHATAFVGDDVKIESFYSQSRNCVPFPAEFDTWIIALTNDICPNATNQLQLTRRDYFAGNLDQIISKTTPESIHKSLFGLWHYDDPLEGQSLHLQPSEDRRHAHQWNKPSGDPNRRQSGNMLGANRLAIEAIPLFFGLPSRDNPDRLLVAGWTGVRSDDSRWTWPIWSVPISLPVVRSVMTLPALQADRIQHDNLRAIGVVTTYRSRRILVEQTPNLTPSVGLGG